MNDRNAPRVSDDVLAKLRAGRDDEDPLLRALDELVTLRAARRRDSRRAEQVRKLRWCVENFVGKVEKFTELAKQWESEDGVLQRPARREWNPTDDGRLDSSDYVDGWNDALDAVFGVPMSRAIEVRLTPEQIEHVAVRAAEVGDGHLEALCDEALRDGPSDELLDHMRYNPDLVQWINVGVIRGWRRRTP